MLLWCSEFDFLEEWCECRVPWSWFHTHDDGDDCVTFLFISVCVCDFVCQTKFPTPNSLSPTSSNMSLLPIALSSSTLSLYSFLYPLLVLTGVFIYLSCFLVSFLDFEWVDVGTHGTKIGWAKATTVLSVLMHHHVSWQLPKTSTQEANDCAVPRGISHWASSTSISRVPSTKIGLVLFISMVFF